MDLSGQAENGLWMGGPSKSVDELKEETDLPDTTRHRAQVQFTSAPSSPTGRLDNVPCLRSHFELDAHR